MKTVALSGSPRENVGKANAKRLRREGKVPAVIYGGKEQKHFYVNAIEFGKLIFTPDVFFINLTIDGEQHNAIIQGVQYHPVTDEILHVDFYEYKEGQPIVMRIPVRVEGVPKGIQKGGILAVKIRRVRIKTLPKFMPDELHLDVSDLDIGDSLKIEDLPQENVEYLARPENVVVGVVTTRGAAAEALDEEEEEEEEAAEGAEGAEGEAAEGEEGGGEEQKSEE
ncbi:MAG: 50S ribosomal protein L25 [Bacteroidales bacterium]|nr:50S ribosomal protein L25 [Bacteroidales bacterium]